MLNKEKARLLALQIKEEVGISEHSLERVAEIICKTLDEKDRGHAKECETMVGIAAKEAGQVYVSRACEQFEKELRQFKNLLNSVRDGAGKLISVGGSLSQFKKALENE